MTTLLEIAEQILAVSEKATVENRDIYRVYYPPDEWFDDWSLSQSREKDFDSREEAIAFRDSKQKKGIPDWAQPRVSKTPNPNSFERVEFARLAANEAPNLAREVIRLTKELETTLRFAQMRGNAAGEAEARLAEAVETLRKIAEHNPSAGPGYAREFLGRLEGGK